MTKPKLFTISILLLSSLALNAQVDLTKGLLAHYPFTGNANDMSGNGKNGTVQNAILTRDRCGKSSSAYSFNGTNASIEIPASTLQTQYYSYSLWINAAEIPGSGKYTYPFSIGAGGAGQNIALSNNTMLGWAGGAYNNGTPSLSLVAKGSLPAINTWYHVVMIRDTTKIKLYINGVLNTYEANYSGATPATGGNLPSYGTSPKALIGSRDFLSQFYFKGMIDDIRIYNRVINKAEIDSLFKEKTCNPNEVDLKNGLLAYYPFTGNAGDSSGNSKHGTVTNATLAKDRCGRTNSAYTFNGTDARIEIPTTSIQTEFYSYSLWVNAAEIPGSGEYTYPFSIGNGAGGQNIALSNNSMLGWAGGAYNNGSPSLSLVAKGSLPSVDKWYHLVYIRDSFKIKLYINGVLNTNEATYGTANTSTGGTTPNYGTSPKAYFGTRDLLSQFYFKGLIDDIRIYDRQLNANEIKALFREKSCYIGIDESFTNNYFNAVIYPNPGSGQFFVDLTNFNGEPLNLTLVNSIGVEVYSTNIRESHSLISLPDMASGIYTVIIQGNSTGTISRLILVN